MVDQPGRWLPFLQGSQAKLDFCALRRLFRQCRKCPQHPECGLVEEFNQAVQVALDKFSAEFRRNTAVPPKYGGSAEIRRLRRNTAVPPQAGGCAESRRPNP
jgi:hypothetical protein